MDSNGVSKTNRLHQVKYVISWSLMSLKMSFPHFGKVSQEKQDPSAAELLRASVFFAFSDGPRPPGTALFHFVRVNRNAYLLPTGLAEWKAGVITGSKTGSGGPGVKGVESY